MAHANVGPVRARRVPGDHATSTQHGGGARDAAARARWHLGAAEAFERSKELIALLDQFGVVFAVHDHRVTVALALALYIDKVVIGLLLADTGARGGRSACARAWNRPGLARPARPQAHARAPRPSVRSAPARAPVRSRTPCWWPRNNEGGRQETLAVDGSGPLCSRVRGQRHAPCSGWAVPRRSSRPWARGRRGQRRRGAQRPRSSSPRTRDQSPPWSREGGVRSLSGGR